MSTLLDVVSKVLPIILLIIAGMFLRNFHIFKEGMVEELKKIVVNLSLPALLFTAFTEATIHPKYLIIIFIVFIICVLLLICGNFFKKILKSQNTYLPALYSGFEAGMMGYAVFAALFGSENIYKFAIMDIGQVIFVFFILVTTLQRMNGTTATAKETLLSFMKTPVIIAILTGILIGCLGLFQTISENPISDSVYETIKLFSTITTPLIGIIIGYELVIDLKKLKNSLIVVVTRMLILLSLALLINELLLVGLLNLDRGFQAALFTMFLLPSPFVIPVFMKSRNENDKQEVLNILSVHILLSLIALTILVSTI